MTKYVLTEQSTEVDGRRGICLCGIAAVQEGCTLDALADISTDRSFVRQMAETLTHGEVSIVHFRDVVEDMLAQL